jgi:hypothetical protein
MVVFDGDSLKEMLE